MNKEIFTTNKSLRIGKIIEVSGNSIRIELDVKITELTRSVYGQIYSVGQIGSIIKIHFGRKILFAYVRMLRMQSDIQSEEGKAQILPGDDKRILEADLFGQGIWSVKNKQLEFNRGVETYPLPLQDAFLCLNDELESIYRAAENLKEDKIKWALTLGLICAGLMYSKYHGVLLILFILLSNFGLFKRKSFYLILFIAVTLCLPHLYWQYLNGFPSFYYHLIDRSASPYRFDYTSQYFLDQVLMMGPLVGWLLFYYGIKLKVKDDLFIKGLKFVVFGIFIFFFLSTFKGRVQAQWPLIEFIALFILAYIYAGNHIHHFTKYKWLFGVNIFLILLARIIIMGAIPPLNQIKFVAGFQNYDVWASQIDSVAKGKPVLFQDGFQDVSHYNFYTQTTKGVAYNSIHYRQTQYDLWPLEDSIQGKDVLLVSRPEGYLKTGINIQTVKGLYNLKRINDVRYYPKISLEPLNFSQEWKKNEERIVTFEIKNPYAKSVHFSNENQKWDCSLQYGFILEGKLIKLENVKTKIPNLKALVSNFVKIKIILNRS